MSLANKYIDYHTKKFGLSKPNVEFRKGYIEKLGEADLKDNTFDVIVLVLSCKLLLVLSI